jgi:hypothetical protein
MNIYNKKYYLVILLIISCYFGIAQKETIKFGKVDISDLEMKVYEYDTSAPAVILCDYGCFDPYKHNFTRILRIKILKKEGYNWANRGFPTSSKTDIKGKTYNLENGKIIIDELNPEFIYEEEVTEYYTVMRVAMPNVKVGSIIDIEFTKQGIPWKWHFQQEIPVKWSELIIQSNHVNFRKNFFGYETLDINTDGRWVAKNMPAFKPEPYMNSSNNYITKFEFDILSVSYHGHYEEYTTSWDAVCKHLLESKLFGFPLKGANYLNRTRNEIKDKYDTNKERLIAAYEKAKKVKWNEEKRLYTSHIALNWVYKKGIGNSSEINLILIQLLKKLNFEAYPVALSTRDKGILSPIFPSLNKLNYVIAFVKTDDNIYLLDATEELMPLGLIPKRCINWRGRIIDREKSDWIELTTDKKDKQVIFYDLTMNEDFSLSGKINYARYDYGAFNFRKEYEKYYNHEEYLDNFIKNKPGLKIINSKIENLDSIYLPVKDKYEVMINNQINVLSNTAYINLMFYDQLKENPFKSDKRNYPVDYAYPIEKTYIIKIKIPENYSITDIPKNINMKMPDNSANFKYNITYFGNTIQLTYKFCINKVIFLPNEYADLKEFYNQIIKKHSEPLIIKTN